MASSRELKEIPKNDRVELTYTQRIEFIKQIVSKFPESGLSKTILDDLKVLRKSSDAADLRKTAKNPNVRKGSAEYEGGSIFAQERAVDKKFSEHLNDVVYNKLVDFFQNHNLNGRDARRFMSDVIYGVYKMDAASFVDHIKENYKSSPSPKRD